MEDLLQSDEFYGPKTKHENHYHSLETVFFYLSFDNFCYFNQNKRTAVALMLYPVTSVKQN